jgi:soluble lytic murein transglycosylase-like protein
LKSHDLYLTAWTAVFISVCLLLIALFLLAENSSTNASHIEAAELRIDSLEVKLADLEALVTEVTHVAGVASRNATSPYIIMEVFRAADKVGLDREVALGLVREESSFRPGVVSEAGAVGLAQVMPATAAYFMPDRDTMSMRDNLVVGFSYLLMLYDRYGDMHTALVAYNVGPGRVDMHGPTRYTNSVRYANRVLGDI